jgi:L-histidine N-alpha-methyltransferase
MADGRTTGARALDHTVALAVAAREELRRALGRTPPEVPSKYLYDDVGMALYEAITQQPEYYPSRVEAELLSQLAPAVAGAVRPREIVELGGGSSDKVLSLVAVSPELRRVTLVDVNAAALRAAARAIRSVDAGVAVREVVADVRGPLNELADADTDARPRLAIFLSGTLGNLHPDAVPGFLRHVSGILAPGDALLLGVDTPKPAVVLEAAYDDAAGVTAAFDRNVLRVLNRDFDADFDVDGFEHRAVWDEANGWIEMRLVARRSMCAEVPGIARVSLAAGEWIRTELCCKYTRERLSGRLEGTGLALERWMTDAQGRFALALVRRRG